MDKDNKAHIIIGYITYRQNDNGDLFTLWHELGDEGFLSAIKEAEGRRIVLYHLPGDGDKCDPPILWKYRGKFKKPRAVPHAK